MPSIPGTYVGSGLSPGNTLNTHETHRAKYGQGGHRTVATTTERNQIPPLRREEGMLVYVVADGLVYILKAGAPLTGNTTNGNWDVFNTGGGGGKTVTAVQTGAYTAAANEIVRVDSTGAAFTVTLPSGPANGDEIEIVDVGGAAATNNITIDRATNPINGVAADVAFDVNYSRVVLIFSSALGWSLQ